tara:strand:+ start:2790 stop:2966 length:177 start_codon:yes stop_codon:yes gene_type:complete
MTLPLETFATKMLSENYLFGISLSPAAASEIKSSAVSRVCRREATKTNTGYDEIIVLS